MWNEILNLALKNGLWAVLFLGLFVFVIKDSTKREQKYQQTIKDLTTHLGIVKDIKEDIDEIKNFVYKKNRTKAKSTSNNTTKKSSTKSQVENTENKTQTSEENK